MFERVKHRVGKQVGEKGKKAQKGGKKAQKGGKNPLRVCAVVRCISCTELAHCVSVTGEQRARRAGQAAGKPHSVAIL
jgi:hypothetical protein